MPRMRTAEIISVGGIAIDLLLHSSSLPTAGRCVNARELHRGLGGKGANQAVAAARLGARVALVGAVGPDEAGEGALRQLRAENVGVDYVARASVPTATVVMHRSDAGEKQTVVFAGANGQVTRETIAAAAPLLAAASIVLVQLEIPLDAVLYLAGTLRGGSARLILDASPARTVPPELLAAATVLKANASEAGALTGIDVRDRASARAAAARLLGLGAGTVAVEAAREGNLFVSRTEEIFLPLHDIPAADATGAGDAMVGALAVALGEGRDLRHAAAFASAAAALATRRTGAQSSMPTRAEIAHFLGDRH